MSHAAKQRQQGAALLMLLMIFGVLGSYYAVRAFGGASQQVEQEAASLAAVVQSTDALLGYAAINGRLPCPATAASNGVESPIGGGVCTNPYNGFLPAATLGLPGVDATGYLLDGWAGRMRYAVTTASANAATTTNGIQTATTAVFGPAANLRVCASATGITPTTCGTAAVVTSNSVALVFSLGPNRGLAGGVDEAANQNNDQVFVSHPKTNSAAANGEFDDLPRWLLPNVLFVRMTQAGRLP
ncbi:MAG: prepilin-type cleavage/methylation domain-containing protein, partial [Sulfuritalea sp.]|nr:prepilin-type cleavage/methylation domain-containing protein [Sulfuritalea sp.]